MWNILPINPVGPEGSPYSAISAFAGNPLLISLDILKEEGLLTEQELYENNIFNEDVVNFEKIEKFKNSVLYIAFNSFINLKNETEKNNFNQYCSENSYWLEDYSLFMALKDYFKGKHWREWDEDISFRKEGAAKRYSALLKEKIEFQKYIQYIFFKQWRKLKEYANKNNIKIMGDIPIYVGDDSCDAWANRELFQFDEKGIPKVVAGAPPDHYSEDGQLWGNPIYDWSKMKENGFLWWIKRIEESIKTYDLIRLDHFRGFEAYWEIPNGSHSAENGKWTKGPGYQLFNEIYKALGEIPIIAENLGIITPEVEELRNYFKFPGMCILQMEIEQIAGRNSFPNVTRNSILYTGNHDNNTLLGWFKTLDNGKKQLLMKELESCCENIVWDIIEYAFDSAADIVIVPMQDLLELDENFRMNTPGTKTGNWGYRIKENQLSEKLAKRLSKVTLTSFR
jgi:4-alpha-glucanotransferase